MLIFLYVISRKIREGDEDKGRETRPEARRDLVYFLDKTDKTDSLAYQSIHLSEYTILSNETRKHSRASETFSFLEFSTLEFSTLEFSSTLDLSRALCYRTIGIV